MGRPIVMFTRRQAMKCLVAVLLIFLGRASFAGLPIPTSTPEGSSFRPLTMPEDEASFAQEYSGSVRVRGTFEAQWTQSPAISKTGRRRLKSILSVAFRPDLQSAKVLPSYSNRGDVKEVWLWPANEVVQKILSAPQARAFIQRRKTVVSGETELLLTNYRIEVTCDAEIYSGKVAQVFSSVAAGAASVKGPNIVAEGC